MEGTLSSVEHWKWGPSGHLSLHSRQRQNLLSSLAPVPPCPLEARSACLATSG